MSLLILAAWIVLNTSLLNIAVKVGWNHDPGYIAPLILIVILNIHLVIYAATRTSTPKKDS